MSVRSGSRSAVLAVLLFILSLPAVTTRFYASDEFEFYAWLRSWTFDRDVDFQNEYEHFYDSGATRDAGFRATFLELTNEAGRRPNFAPAGAAILWAPFYAVGHTVALLTSASDDGYSRPYIAAVAIGSAVYGALAVTLSFVIARRVTGVGGVPAIAVLFGTPLVFYMYVAPGFSHACSAFAVSLFLLAWLRARVRWRLRDAVALGVAGGLMSMVREQDLFFVAGPAIDFMLSAWAARRAGNGGTPVMSALKHHPLALATAGAVSFIVSFSPQLFAYHALNGHPGPTILVARKMTWTSPHFFDVLLSPSHGFFFWTPLAVVALAGLVWLTAGRVAGAHAEARRLGAIVLLMFAVQIYVTGCVESWTVAGAFGQRRFVATTPLLAIGIAALWVTWARQPWRRLAGGALIAVCVWWNVGLMAQFGLHTMDRQRLSVRDNARATFVDIPGATPALLWRYLTDRSSFYGRPRAD